MRCLLVSLLLGAASLADASCLDWGVLPSPRPLPAAEGAVAAWNGHLVTAGTALQVWAPMPGGDWELETERTLGAVPTGYLHVAGDMALLDVGGDLQVYRLRQGAVPSLLGALELPGPAQSMALVGSRLVAVISVTVGSPPWFWTEGRPWLVDLADPAHPEAQGWWPGKRFSDVAEASGRLVSGGYDGLEIWDLDAPADPVRLGGTATVGGVCGLAVDGTRAALLSDDGNKLWLVDLAEPTTPLPSWSGLYPWGGGYDVTNHSRLALAGDRLVVADPFGGCTLVEVDGSPRIAGRIWQGMASSLTMVEDRLVLGDGSASWTLDRDELELFAGASSFAHSWMGTAAHSARGSWLDAAAGEFGWVAYSLEDPAAPAREIWNPVTEVLDVATIGDVTLLALADSQLVSLRDPGPADECQLLGTLQLESAILQLEACAAGAVLTTRGDLWVVALDGQGAPLLRGRLPLGDGFLSGGDLAASGTRAALGTRNVGPARICLVDLSQPDEPRFASSIRVNGFAGRPDVDLDGTLLAISGDPAQLVDVEDPDQPVVRATGGMGVAHVLTRDNWLLASGSQELTAMHALPNGDWEEAHVPDTRAPWAWAGAGVWLSDGWGQLGASWWPAPCGTGDLQVEITVANGRVHLEWPEDTGGLWTVRRALTPDFAPAGTEILGTTTSPWWIDPLSANGAAFYRVTMGRP